MNKITAIIATSAVVAALAGCVVIGKVDHLTSNGQAFTSRSTLQNIVGSNKVEAVKGMEGGGTLTPNTTVTP